MQYIKTFFASACLIVFLFVHLNAQTQFQNNKLAGKEKKEMNAKQVSANDKIAGIREKEISITPDSGKVTRQGNWDVEKSKIENKKVDEEIIPPE